jgi:hypothetical protein
LGRRTEKPGVNGACVVHVVWVSALPKPMLSVPALDPPVFMAAEFPKPVFELPELKKRLSPAPEFPKPADSKPGVQAA